MKPFTYISVSLKDRSRPAGRPPKTNWKIELIKKGMKALQHASPKKVAEVVWHFFTIPGKVYFSEPQRQLIARAELGEMTYKGDKIVTYKWRANGPKILLCHGWRSKAADFRKMIEAFLAVGFQVEAVDNHAHGMSEGKHTAMPEYREIIREYIKDNGPFDIAIGYSMGGSALAVALSELPAELKPKKLFLIGAPPYITVFFKDILAQAGLKRPVYEKMLEFGEAQYGHPMDYFDLRTKSKELAGIEKFLIYCEDDETIPFAQGMELYEALNKDCHFAQVRGFGHYKIISNEKIINHIHEQLKPEVNELSVS